MNRRLAAARICALIGATFLAASCGGGGGRKLAVGVVDDAARSGDPASFVDELTRSGFDALAVSSIWEPGETEPAPDELKALRRVAEASDAAHVRLFVIVYNPGSSTTPLTTEARSQFARYAASLATGLPSVHDVVVGNEPNLNRFWLPQFGPQGENVSAASYLSLLAATYDAVKGARDDVRIWGGATAPRGADRPGSSRQTTSPTEFIRALGDAYRRSGRDRPVMDGFVHHPYPESASVSIDLPHPHVKTIGLADYGKLVRLLAQAFDDTAQRGRDLPILYGEIGVETAPPPGKRSLYDGDEITSTASEPDQAAAYRRTLELSACQPQVAGVLFFHLRDEPSLAGWQSGVRYVDGTPKHSLALTREAVRDATSGRLEARCNS
jgi:hypothetical protein